MKSININTLALVAAFAAAMAACNASRSPNNSPEPEVTRGPDREMPVDPGKTEPVFPATKDEVTPGRVRETSPRESPATIPHSAGLPERAGRKLADQAYLTTPIATPPGIRPASEPVNRETYAHFDDNPLRRVAEAPVSTFSIDVDTGAYSNARRILNAGRLPVKNAVRVEEMINYFDYDYPAPRGEDTPFRLFTEVAPTPWNAQTHLLHIGIQGYDLPREELPPANLVFLVDVSGSMQSENKLGLLKSALKLLARQLRATDTVSIVVYAGASGVVLEPTSGDRKGEIIAALEGLAAGGSTNGGAGIRLAYAMASQGYVEGGINRVIIATDGDFNVGTVDFEALTDLVEDRRTSGISLTTLGFGAGNYNDHLMEQLADAGNGNHAYIDTLNEARKVLVEEMSSTLRTIARDVKIQVEFNPTLVSEYRLIGYENRTLRREDFSNDKVDAGEIGAGHSVTALYEIALTGGGGNRVKPLRYGATPSHTTGHPDELAMLRVRYKEALGQASRLVEAPVRKTGVIVSSADTSDRYRFSAAVAGFGQLLRGGRYLDRFGYEEVLDLARGARGDDTHGYRGEFITLVSLAAALETPEPMASR
ncbi:MAG: VWA domain-containing protein [Pseudomonadota bacterium]|nr:VWA domain-containing protein [Pseudomonadota bacterium]